MEVRNVPRLVGKGLALRLILTGNMITAEEAFRIGLVNEVLPASDLIVRAQAILKQIASNAPIAVRLALEAVNKGMETTALEGAFFAICTSTEDKKEGMSAFLEKRAPAFYGR